MGAERLNWFDSDEVAERYRRARPAFHDHVIERLRPFLAPILPLDRSLDVGCGAGASTRALAKRSPKTVGIDPALPMIRRARRPGSYVAGRGEEMPFRDGSFDLLTVSQAIHWMDRSLFLPEASRVLRSGGRLIVYDNYFADDVPGRQGFEAWLYRICLKRHPPPPRGQIDFEPGETVAGFRCLARDYYENTISFSRDELVDFLLTQSSVIAAIEGGEPQARMTEWLAAETEPFFQTESLTVRFGGPIWILSKENG